MKSSQSKGKKTGKMNISDVESSGKVTVKRSKNTESKSRPKRRSPVFNLEKAKDKYPDVWQFYQDCCFSKNGIKVSASDAYQMYLHWWENSEFNIKTGEESEDEEENCEPTSDNPFWRFMANLWPKREQCDNKMWYLDMDVAEEYQKFKTTKKQGSRPKTAKKVACEVEATVEKAHDTNEIQELRAALQASEKKASELAVSLVAAQGKIKRLVMVISSD